MVWHSRSSWALLALVLALISSPATQAQTSPLPSPAIVLPSPQTMPTDSTALQTFLELAETALESSETSDAKLQAYEVALALERKQRQKDNADRLSEIRSWQTISETLSLRVGVLQTFSDDLLARLGSFSGSEADKHAAAVKALDAIQAGVKAKDIQIAVMKYGMIGAVAVAVVAVIVAIVR